MQPANAFSYQLLQACGRKSSMNAKRKASGASPLVDLLHYKSKRKKDKESTHHPRQTVLIVVLYECIIAIIIIMKIYTTFNYYRHPQIIQIMWSKQATWKSIEESGFVMCLRASGQGRSCLSPIKYSNMCHQWIKSGFMTHTQKWQTIYAFGWWSQVVDLQSSRAFYTFYTYKTNWKEWQSSLSEWFKLNKTKQKLFFKW